MFFKVGWKEFVQKAEKCEDIMCIGAGKRLKHIEEVFDNEILNKVKYIADNDLNKQGTEIEIGNRKIVVQSVLALIPELNENTIVIIVPIFFRDILRQLESYNEFFQTSIFAFSYLIGSYYDSKALEKEIPDNLRLSKEKRIPKKIHYCWFGRNPLPEKYKKWMGSWKKHCPDYEIIEWNEDNYDISKNKYMKQAYEAKKWGFVPDYARLDIIYNYGGIYLDTDVELIKSLDDLLYQEAFAGFESDQYVALGLGFGAVAGNKLIGGMLEDYDRYSFIDKSGEMNLTPSPIISTEYLKKHGLVQNGEYQILDDCLTIYPEKFLSGKGGGTREICLASYTHSIHHYDASWLDDDEKQIRNLIKKEMQLED